MKPLLIALILALCASFPVVAATYTVTNTNNSGAGSFRQAIEDCNSNSGHDTIDFNIPGAGPQFICLTSWLPAFTDRVTIDGYSQQGAARATDSTAAVIMIELNGSSAIFVPTPHGVQIDGNHIGTNVTGTIAKPNEGSGIEIQ